MPVTCSMCRKDLKDGDPVLVVRLKAPNGEWWEAPVCRECAGRLEVQLLGERRVT